MADEKKIIIDDDWKKQAQQEKEKVSEEIKKEHEKEEEQKKQPPMPKGDFLGLVSMLSTQAYFALGLMGNPDTKEQPKPNIEMAKYLIDVLGDLEEKTKGNLSDQEKEALQGSLSQLRMIFVKITEDPEAKS